MIESSTWGVQNDILGMKLIHPKDTAKETNIGGRPSDAIFAMASSICPGKLPGNNDPTVLSEEVIGIIPLAWLVAERYYDAKS